MHSENWYKNINEETIIIKEIEKTIQSQIREREKVYSMGQWVGTKPHFIWKNKRMTRSLIIRPEYPLIIRPE